MSKKSAEEFVLQLRQPLGREEAVAELALMGTSAVKPLVAFLLAGPGNEHEPGCLAVEALELIGGEEALNGLFAALLERADLHDAVENLHHEAVRDCICHALERIGDQRAVAPLLLALRQYHLVGAGEALAGFVEHRAIPLLVALLEDSFKRARVSEAILRFGKAATESLVKTIKVKRLQDDQEVLPSIERRAEAAKLLGLIRDKDAVPPLGDLLDDDQEPVRLEAAISLAVLLTDKTPDKAVQVIRSARDGAGLRTRLRAEEALCLTKRRNAVCP